MRAWSARRESSSARRVVLRSLAGPLPLVRAILALTAFWGREMVSIASRFAKLGRMMARGEAEGAG